ncbi:nSTAND1 domain-containing NTPase [Azohydromonas aeria]|uniref:nSTAND1 domain-containing NTPase n=1 Tax=Azohydromonas aeria TaxID=2590212 RepID=UPI0012F7C8C3|nr:hypothetical protein [Azohydromonas aeria]
MDAFLAPSGATGNGDRCARTDDGTDAGAVPSCAVRLDAQHPWPGLAAYDEGAQGFFHGREDEAAELLRLIRLSPLAVLYGKSGLGKSSLLMAGVFPALRAERFLPVYVRVDFGPQAACAPLEQVARRLEEEIARTGAEAPPRAPGQGLWEYLHRRDLEIWSADNHLLTPVLVLDQFEELFSRGGVGRERIGSVFDAMADLIENRIPAELCEGPGARERLRALALDAQPARVVLSFREDFLPEVEGWKDRVPSLLRSRLRLLPMTARQAVAATERAGAAVLAPGVAAAIVDFVSRCEEPGGGTGVCAAAAGGEAEVEPVLLSLCCTQLNRRRAPGARVDEALLASAGQDILQSFHDEALVDLPERVPRFIETHLVQGGRYRGSYPRDEALAQGLLTAAELAALTEQHRLLRIEQQQGVARIELIHDRLVGIVARARDARLAREAAQQREQALAHEAAQREAALERRRREQSERARAGLARMRNGLGALTLMLCALLGFALWAFQESVDQKQAAQERGRRANALRLAAQAQAMLIDARVESDELALQLLLAAHRLEPGAVDGNLLQAVLAQPGLARLVDAGTPLRALAVSRDGTRIATAGDDGRIQLRDGATGRPVGEPLSGHVAAVQALAFSPDGRRLASASDDQTLRLWDGATGRPLGGALQGHEGHVLAMAFSADGRRLASGGEDGSLRLWDAEDGRGLDTLLQQQPGRPVQAVAFSPDGRWLAAGDVAGQLWRWHAAAGAADAARPAPPVLHPGGIHALAFSPDAAQLASAGQGGDIRLWDAATAAPLGAPLPGHGDEVHALAFSPDGARLAAGGAGEVLRLWDLRGRRLLEPVFDGFEGRITALAFNPDGERLLSASLDGNLRWWRSDDAAALDALVLARRERARGRFLAESTVPGVLAYTLQPMASAAGPSGVPPVPPHGLLLDLAWSPDGRRIATAHGDHALRLWDAATGRPLGEPLRGHGDRVLAVAFSPDGRWIASAGADRTVRRWDAATGQPQGAALAGHTDRVTGVAFSPDGAVLVSGSHDGSLRRWDAATGAALGAPLQSEVGEIWAVAWSPDGRRLAAAGGNGRVRLWDASNLQPLGAPLAGHKDRVMGLAFSPDGALLASAGWDHAVRLWDARTGEPRGELQGDRGPVLRVVFRPDGKRLVAGGWLGVLRVWDVESRRLLGMALEGQRGPVAALAFSPDARRIAAAGTLDAVLHLWPAPGVWPQTLCERLTRNMSPAAWAEWVGQDERYRCQCEGLPVEGEAALGRCAQPEASRMAARP